VPDLLDGGFLTGGNGSAGYSGWRDGSFYVPVSLLKPGVNTVQFSDEEDADPTPESAAVSNPGLGPPVAIKALVFQLNYVPAPATPDALQPQLSMPTGPIPPTESSSTPPQTNTP
jgi:hypothetical protein